MAYIPSECSLEEYEKVIYSGDAKNRLYVKHGDTIIGTNGDNNASPFASKLTVKRRILKNGSKTITLNNFISQEIDLVLHDYKIEDLSEEIEIKIGTFIDSVNDYVYVPLGKFLIQDNPTTDKDKTTYKLRDFSVKFDFYYNGKPLIDANGGSATKMQILQDICEQAGVVCKINSFTGYNEKIGIYDNSVTARTYIAYLAEQAGKMASINRYGELVFVDITSDEKIVTGERSIIINDALEKRINSFVVQGNAQQEKREGYNLFNIFKYRKAGYTATSNGVTYTVLEDGGIKVSGTTTDKVSDFYIGGYWGNTNTIETIPAGTYKIIVSGKTSNGCFFMVNNTTVKVSCETNFNRNFTLSADTDITYFFLRTYEGLTVDYTVYVHYYEGTETKPYEMYGKQPSIDYPSEIETVKGIENLLSETSNLIWYGGSGGTFISNTNATSIIGKVNKTGKYTIHKKNIGNRFVLILSNEKPDVGITYAKVITEGNHNLREYTFEATEGQWVWLGLDYNSTQEEKEKSLEKCMLEYGSVKHPYVPYGRYLYNQITGKQLFDYKTNFQSSIAGLTNTINSDGSITISGIPEYAYVGVVTRYDITHKLIDGEEYTISQSVNTNAVTIEVRAVNKISGAITYYQHNKTFTVDLNSYTYNIALLTGTLSSWGTETRTITGFYQLERGSKSTEPEPYKEKIIIYDLKKENLFDKNTIKLNSFTNTTTGEIGYSDTQFVSDYIDIEGIKTLSCNAKSNTSLQLYGCLYDKDKNFLITFTERYDETIKLPDIGAKYIVFTFRNLYLDVLDDLVIYEGTGTDRYHELASKGNFVDNLDEISGKLTKNMGKIILDGTNNKFMGKHPSIATETNGFYQFHLPNKIKGSNGSNTRAICTHLEYVNITNASQAIYQNCLWWEGSTLSNYASIPFLTLTEANQWLIDEYNKGTPVTIYYMLVEPEIIQLQPTEISTFEGVNNITLMDNIDTTINVNYEGQKHIHNISPDIVEKFTVGDTYKVSKVLFEAGVNKFEDGTDDNDTLYLNSDNPYINQQTQINNIYPNVKGFEINSFKTGKILGNPTVDPADLIKIEYNDIIYKTLAQYTLNFGGTMTSTYETTVEHEAKQSNVNNNGTAQLKKFVKAELDNIDAKFSVEVGEVNSSLSDLETNINNTADRVSNTESKLNDTNSSVEELVGRTTKLEQDSKGWEFEFTSIYEDLTALDNKITETDTTTKEIKDYIKFVDGDIILGSSDSENSLVISKTEIAFMTGNNKSAYITNNELYITDNTVLNKQTVGKWETKPDSEGNLNTRWIG